MDAIDRKILTLLQQDASRSVAEIGSLVGLSSTPCWKRIQRLELDGIVQKRVALVDQDKVGLGVTVFVSIETGDHSQGWLDRFADEVGALPEVMEFYRMAGDVDYMLRVVVSDIQGYDDFLQAVDRSGAAQERHLAFCHGENQSDHSLADYGRRNAQGKCPTTQEMSVNYSRPESRLRSWICGGTVEEPPSPVKLMTRSTQDREAHC